MNPTELRLKSPTWDKHYRTIADFLFDGKNPVDWKQYPDAKNVMDAFDWYDNEVYTLQKLNQMKIEALEKSGRTE